MPYVLNYLMMVGAGSRVALTATDAAASYNELKAAGASFITITDHTGRVLTVDDLKPRRPASRAE